MELVTRQSQKNTWRLRKDEKLTTLRIFICVLLVKVDVCRKRTLVTFIAAFFISIIQNTLLWGCFLPIFAFQVLIFKGRIAFIPPVGRQLLCFVWTWLSYFARKLIPEWRKDEYLAKMRGHSRVGVDGILEEAELCRITHPMNDTSNFHTWLTHSFRSSKIVILNSNKSIFLPTRPIQRIVAISCHLLIIKIVFEISQLKSLDQISF